MRARGTLDDLWDFDDLPGSEARFRHEAEQARVGAATASLAEVLTQLARAEGLQRRFDDAAATLAEAEAALAPDDARARCRLHLERGRVANTSRAAGRGREDFLAAWELARAEGEDGLAVDAAHMLGIVEPADDALAWNRRAMALARSSADPGAHRWIAPLANNLGWAAHAAGEHEEALALFRLALDERLKRGEATPIRIARWCVARCQRSLGQLEEALSAQRALLDELDATGATDGYVQEEIGECLLALGRGEEARPYLARAFVELSADDALREAAPERLERLRALGAAPAP